MPKRLGTILVAALLALAFCSGGAEAAKLSSSELDALVRSVLEAHGGAEDLRKVSSYKIVGRIRDVRRNDEGTGTVYFQRPGKLLSDNRYRESREVRILNGTRGWLSTDGAFEPAPPGVMLGMLYSLVSYKLPLELADRRQRLSYLGRVEQLGRRFEVLELDYSEVLKVRVYVEDESRRIAQVAGYITVGEQTVILSQVLGDYREVDGLVYPFHQRFHSGPTLIGEKWVESVEVNPQLSEGRFSPP